MKHSEEYLELEKLLRKVNYKKAVMYLFAGAGVGAMGALCFLLFLNLLLAMDSISDAILRFIGGV